LNAIVIEHPARIKAEIRSFASLAHTLSRISVQRAQWAEEAEAQGNINAANRFAKEAAEKRFQANWYLQKAMDRKDRSYARS
jgi:hypothetical protein